MCAEIYNHSISVAWISPGVKWLEREVKVKNVSALRHFCLYMLVKQSKREVSQHTVKSYAEM
jgi:hypothetical protein